MRREIDIRKRRKILADALNKKAILIIGCLVLFLIICSSILAIFIQNHFIKVSLENENMQFASLNEDIPFSIQKIVLFSSATATSETVNQSLSLDISPYCDIAIYLDSIKNSETSIQSLSIHNISLSTSELGTPYLYQKRIHDFGKCSFENDKKIDKSFSYSIIDKDSQIPLNEDNYELYNDGSTPITLGFYNQNVKTNFLLDSHEIYYNGTLLKYAFIPQSSIQCQVSFTIYIIATDGSQYICNVYFMVPLETEKGSVYDTGYISQSLEGSDLSKFIRIQ